MMIKATSGNIVMKKFHIPILALITAMANLRKVELKMSATRAEERASLPRSEFRILRSLIK